METLDPNDIEVLDPNDMEIIAADDFEVLPPPTMLDQAASFVQPVTDFVAPIASTAMDFALGAGQGAGAGFVDEVGGALGAGAESLYNQFNPTDVALREEGFSLPQPELGELYRGNQQDIQQQFTNAQENSPVINTAGNIGGALVGAPAAIGAATAAGVKALGIGASPLAALAADPSKMARLGQLGLTGARNVAAAIPGLALEGVGSSQTGGLLNEKERSQLVDDVVDTVGTGAALMGAGSVIGGGLKAGASAVAAKTKEALKDSPLAQQLGIAYDYGTQKINPRDAKFRLATELGTVNNGQIDNKRTKDLVDEIYSANQKIGKEVSKSIENATGKGLVIDITPDAQSALEMLQNVSVKYPEITENANVRRIYQRIAETGKVDPTEAKNLLDAMDRYIGIFKSTTDPLQKDIKRNLSAARKNFSNTLKEAIPEYRQAAERYESFNKLVPETIIAGASTPEVDGKFFSTMNNGRKPLSTAIKKLNQGATSGNSDLDSSFSNTIVGIKQFEADDAARLARGEISEAAMKTPASAIEENIKRNSNDAIVRNSKDALEGGGNHKSGALSAVKDYITGGGGPLKGTAIAVANRAGRASAAMADGPVGKIGTRFAKAPDKIVRNAAEVLSNVPGLQSYGSRLTQALDSGNVERKNQILFTIMQNPAARSALGEDHEDDQDE